MNAQHMSPGRGQPARIALVVSHDLPGGAQLLWEQLAQQFRARDIETYLVAIQGRSYSGAEDTAWQAVMQGRLTPLNMPWATWLLRRKFAQLQPDMIVCALPAANVMAPLAAWMAGVPVRVTSHHSPVSTHQALLRHLDRIIGGTPAVTWVISVSRAVRDSLTGYSAAYLGKSDVIRNALPPAVSMRLKAAARRREGVPTGRMAEIVAAGRLAEQKNYPTLLQAMVRVRGGHLSIIGDGPDADALHALAASLNLGDKITFMGQRTHAETLSQMAGADIFVQPSLFEGHSLALLEAATLGLPMILSDFPTQTEAVTRADGTRHAIIVPTLDADALGDAINSVIETPGEIARLSDQALVLSDDFHFSDTVDAYLALWSASISPVSAS